MNKKGNHRYFQISRFFCCQKLQNEIKSLFEEMQRRHNIYSLDDRRKALAYKQRLEEGETVQLNGHTIKTVTDLANMMEIDRGTLYYWQGLDWDKDSVEERLSKRGRKATLTTEQKEAVADWIVGRGSENISTSAENITTYVRSQFGWEPQASWVSKFTKAARLSSQITQKKPTKVLALIWYQC